MRPRVKVSTPDELTHLLARDERAAEAYASLPQAHKVAYLRWIAQVRTATGRAKRVEAAGEMLRTYPRSRLTRDRSSHVSSDEAPVILRLGGTPSWSPGEAPDKGNKALVEIHPQLSSSGDLS